MKLAVIDYKSASNRLKDFLKLRGVEVEIAETLDELEEQHGALNKYDGLLLHPHIREWARCLKDIPQKYPDLRYAIATHGLSEYLNNSRIRVFDFADVNEIFDYFFGKDKILNN